MKKAYCFVSIAPVRADQSDRAEIVTQLLFGEIISVIEINEPWAKIITYADNYEGYIDFKHFKFISEKEVNRWLDGLSYLRENCIEITTPWGLQTIFKGAYLPYDVNKSFNIGQDEFTLVNNIKSHPTKNAFEIASEYLNAPYLWGGRTPFGIDCSGLTQMVFRFLDINLPRDASQQIEYGQTIDFNDIEAGDVAFFNNKDGKIIHVGICDGKGRIIHASGHVRIDEITVHGIYNHESQRKTHQLHSIKRM